MEIDFIKIKVVFFDIGGVMLSNGWDHKARKKAAKHFAFDYEEMNILHNFIFNVYEVGSISLDEYLDIILFHTPQKFSKSNFIEFMFAQSTELPELSYLKEWKKKIELPVFSINNEGLELNEFRIKKFNLHQVFDGFFSSCLVGCRKPDPRIFQKAIQIAQVLPEECIYFDDRPMLVKAAQQLGMNAILHQEFTATKGILEKLLLN